ncbi:ead/Ea22-like family protein [Escherichia coli]|nr:ead/Ea22-like family protein [Escherichia coli]
MSQIDYQALRAKAEKATWGDWDSYKPHRGARGYEVRLSSQAIAQHVLKNNAEFIAAFNPKIALALLDERERNQQYIKRRDQENEEIALTVGRLRVELEAAKKRIAELEAEPVSQTYKLNELSGNSPGTPDCWIPVSERMPEPYEYVLVTDGFDGCEVMRVNTDGYWGPAKSLYPGSITHWMPLPAAPQQDGE